MGVQFIDQINIRDKRILLRVDFDVSFNDDGSIENDLRIRGNVPTIQFLLQNNNKIICVAKLGRPKERDAKHSIKTILPRLQSLFPHNTLTVIDDFLTVDPAIFQYQKPDEIILLENIRFYPEEKENNPEFAKKLASRADVYVNDAFACSHRSDASIVGIPQFLPSYGGLLLKKELQSLDAVTKNPQRPVVVIIGGAKIPDKIGLIKALLAGADTMLVGGGVANTFLKGRGIDIKKSLVDEEGIRLVGGIPKEKLVLPVDFVWHEEKIVDIGPQTREQYRKIISSAKTIIWNGPMGLIEEEQFQSGTIAVFNAIISNPSAHSVVGGGHTIGVVLEQPGHEKITHISTGGGAMLEYIEKGTLPGIEALANQKRA